MLTAILRRAADEGLHLYVEDGRLKYRARAAGPSDTLRADIVAHKAELTALLVAQVKSGARQSPSTGRLSQAQARVFHQETAFDTGQTYLMAVAYRFDGLLDPDRLSRAFALIIDRHHVLRSRFFIDDSGAPVQKVLPQTGFTLAHAVGVEPEAWLRDCGHQRCDLDAGDVFKASLLHHHGQSYLHIACHHIACDGWSWGNILSELATFHDGADLSPLALQYLDHVQRQPPASTDYWLDKLAGVGPLNTIRGDLPRPARATFTGQTLRRAIPDETATAMAALARAQGVSIVSAYLAAFSLLVSRYTGSDDCLIGSPVAGRNAPDLAPLVGMFANVLPLRLAVDEEQNFIALMTRTHASLQDSQRHDLPFEEIVQALGFAGEQGFTPLTQIVFSCDPGAAEQLTLGGMTGTKLDLPRDHVNFELELHLIGNEAGGLDAIWAYADQLFVSDTVTAIGDAFDRLLAALIRTPDAPLRHHALVGEEVILRGPATNYPLDDISIADLFEAEAARTPQQIACRWSNPDGSIGQMDYGTLNTRANALAFDLAQAGAGIGDHVAVTVEQPRDTLIGMLAVQKLGAAYLVLDPAQPETRNRAILGEAACRFVLGGDPTQDVMAGRTVLPWALVERRENPNRSTAKPDDPAFIVFTSGSTGTPKGVVIPRRALTNLIFGARDLFGFHAGQCAAVASTLTFDAHLFEIYVALACGGTLALLDPTRSRDGAQLMTDQEALGIDYLFATPSGWRHLLDDGWQARSSMTLLTGGEILPQALSDRLLAPGNIRLLNLYGPCEGTAFSLAAEMTPGVPVHLGRPSPNTSAVIRDRHDHPCPVGCPGELVLGGAQIASGYLGGTKGFSQGPMGREYATDDIARLRSDGMIEVLGRADSQTKINGVRLEPGEVEAALESHPLVDQAVALAVETEAGRRLAAYVTGRLTQDDVAALATYLETLLPRGFLPSFCTVLDDWPLTSSGKIDRKALPAPVVTVTQGRAPANALERTIAEIWSGLLGHTVTDAEASFYTLGGHSLLAINMLNQINRHCGTSLAMRDLTGSLTIAALAKRVGQTDHAVLTPIPKTEPCYPAPLSFAQERIWAIDRISAAGQFYTIPVIFDVTGPLEPDRLRAFLTQMLNRHDMLRSRYVGTEGAPQQEIGAAPAEALTYLDLTNAPNLDTALRQAETDCIDRPFDLATGPVLRSTLVRLDATHHRWFIAVHHIAFDGVSLRIFLDELQDFLTTGALPDAPALRYGDYARWQRDTDDGADLPYWRARLADAPALHNLPTDRPRPAVQDHRGATLVSNWSPDTTARLNALARESGTTPFTAVLAVIAAYLTQLSDGPEIVFGTPVANRPDPALDRLIGCFVNTVPLRLRPSPADGFRANLAALHGAVQTDMAHQALPFEKIVSALHPTRSFAHSPVFQIMVALDNSESAAFSVEDTRFTAVQPTETEAKFDLSIGMRLGDQIGISWNYATALFDAATVEAMASDCARFADALMVNAETPLHQLMPDNAQPMLHGPTAPINRNHFAKRFSQTAMEHPDAPAIVMDTGQITYAQLLDRAERLSDLLAEHGVGPGALVGLHMARDADMIVALVAIHLCEAAYLPLDPAYPAARLAAIVEDARPQLVLYCGDAPDLTAKMLDPQTGQVTQTAKGTPRDLPNDTAYVIYTSGSTGRPKGVAVGHDSLCNYLDWLALDIGLQAGDRMLQVTSPSFDISISEILAPLSIGASIVLAPPSATTDAQQLGQLIRQHRVTMIQMVPTMLRMLVDGWSTPFDSVRTLLCGGEAVPATLLHQARDLFRQARILTVYGPTEATVWVTVSEFTGTETGIAPIGQPIRNTMLAVLNADLQPVRQGRAGRLHIGGAALAHSYLGDPERTAAAFAIQDGLRLYDTGDLVKQGQDGALLFLGRDDGQVKLRGYRIELGDIEAHLLACGATQAVCLIADEVLSAFVTHPTPEALRADLAARLPAHMIPSRIVALDAFPLTPNGKIDRKALAEHGPVVAAPQSDEPPQGEVEETLADIWQEVLEIDRIGRHDNFFAIGGQSMRAIRVMRIISDMLEQDVPVKLLFTHQTIATLAAHMIAHVLPQEPAGAIP